MLIEMAFSHPRHPEWAGFVRVHHRSGLYGVVSDPGGSNFIGVGVRRSL